MVTQSLFGESLKVADDRHANGLLQTFTDTGRLTISRLSWLLHCTPNTTYRTGLNYPLNTQYPAMSSLRRKVTVTRRPSLLDEPTPSTQRTATSRTSSPSMFNRASNRIRGFYDGTFNDTSPAFHMLTPPSSSSTTLTSTERASRPQISRLAKSFADALVKQKLSDFLIWFLYYDIVELPESSETWYAPLDASDIRGWIALGTFLCQTHAVGADYGLDLVVLDSICDRLHLHRSLVHEILIRFVSPKKMAFGILATTIQRAEQARMAKLPLLVEVQAKLQAMNQLASRLAPTKNSNSAVWQSVVLKRVRGLLHLVIGPRILHIRDGKPLLTAATNDSIPKDVLEGIKLNYLFEVVQLERRVPMEKYGLQEKECEETILTASSTLPPSSSEAPDKTDLLGENCTLKETIARLTHENRDLLAANEDLMAKLELAISACDTSSTSADAAHSDNSSPSSVYDGIPPLNAPTSTHRHYDTNDRITRLSKSPTLRLSEPRDFDLQLAVTLSSSPPAIPAIHPAHRVSYCSPTDQSRLRRSGFVGRDRLPRLGIDGVDALKLRT